MTAMNNDKTLTFTVGSNVRTFSASSYFSNELYPAFSIWTISNSIKVSNIKFDDMQC